MSDGDVLAAEIALRDAWPGLETEGLAGWQLRASHGGYNRANSVWPGRFSEEISVDEAIGRAEAFYRRRGLPTRFQVIRIAEPGDLDERLDRLGYRRELDCSDLGKPVTDVAAPANVTFSADPSTAWLGLYLPAQPPKKEAELAGIVAKLPPRRSFIVARIGGEPAGVGLASRVGADVAVDCVMTSEAFRRSGAATAVMRGAEAWAFGEGARRLVLSVIDDNRPAVTLYRKLGYRPLCAYHYRVKDG